VTTVEDEHHYHVYMMASRSHVLYVGVTNNVQRRTEEHREKEGPGFTGDYRCNRLVWFEHYRYIGNAISREKQIKRWGRAKKIWLIEQTNPTWADLSDAWKKDNADLSTALRSGRDDKVE
jgi:putative endonuclease